MNKVVCFIFGHKLKTEKCPVTNASKIICERCTVKNNHSKMSFI